ncbi:Antigen 10-3 isoform 1 [Schistosoma japonicum]|uniref:Antigen 10-3 isoform 1 n=1 Tax=Schistosoma japonicum TaxID=6182 RepID=A0A4Z2DBA9_SCHJA|nr:Antigen 10-3 isoform 1 [Schistosoma japonicum]
MKINTLGIICLVSLYISQAYTHDVDLRDQLSSNQKDYIKNKIRLLNDYFKSKGIDKQFTEKDIYDLLNTRMNKHIQDKNIDIHIIHKKNETQPVRNNTTHPPKNNTTHPPKNNTTHPPKNNTTHPPNYEKIDSLSKVFQLKKAFIPVWILNPLYYIIEKLIQFFAYLVEEGDFYELEPPVHYYDYSV